MSGIYHSRDVRDFGWQRLKLRHVYPLQAQISSSSGWDLRGEDCQNLSLFHPDFIPVRTGDETTNYFYSGWFGFLGVRIEEGEELVRLAKYKSMKVCIMHHIFFFSWRLLFPSLQQKQLSRSIKRIFIFSRKTNCTCSSLSPNTEIFVWALCWLQPCAGTNQDVPRRGQNSLKARRDRHREEGRAEREVCLPTVGPSVNRKRAVLSSQCVH